MNRSKALMVISKRNSLRKERRKLVEERWGKSSFGSPKWILIGEKISTIDNELASLRVDHIRAIKTFL